MQTTRRTFIKYASLLGAMSFFGLPLFAQERVQVETIGSTHLDEHFDPEGWL
jgi:hypothetical protein